MLSSMLFVDLAPATGLPSSELDGHDLLDSYYYAPIPSPRRYLQSHPVSALFV